MKRTLILGYGNPDREDDGAAWHILIRLAERMQRPIPVDFSDGLFPSDESPEMMFVLQLVPELAEKVAEFDRVCFLDAHTGNVSEDLHMQPVDAYFQTSPFTHHFTPQSLLSMTASLYEKHPEGIMVSVRGYQFGFAQILSPKTEEIVRQAEELVWQWIQKE